MQTATETKCLRCGSDNLTPANFESTGKIYSRPKDAKLVSVLTTGVVVDANLCLDCGYVELHVDADRARAIKKEAECTPILTVILNSIAGILAPLKPSKS